MTWKRLIPIPTFRAGRFGDSYPDYLGSWLTHRFQLTTVPGGSPWLDRINPFMPTVEYWRWTDIDVIVGYKKLREQETGKPENWEDMTCPQCNGNGRIKINTWQAWCLCTLVEKIAEHYAFNKSINYPFAPARIGEFSIYEANGRQNESFENAQEGAHRFALEPMTWLILIGKKGLGKTHLLRAIATNYGPGVFLSIRASDFIQRVMRWKNSEDIQEYVDRIKYSWILGIDDIGAAYMKLGKSVEEHEGTRMPFAMSMLHDVIDHRWNNRDTCPTVITSNETAESFTGDTWGPLGDRIVDEHHWTVALNGESHRQNPTEKEKAKWKHKNI